METTKHGILKKSLCFLLCVLMMSAAVPVSHAAGVYSEGNSPSDESTYGYTYRFVTFDTVEITSYNGYDSVVTVPSYIDGYKVVGIKDFHTDYQYSDFNPVVKKVVLPDTVTYISDEAFYDSSYTDIHSELEEIVLPNSLKTIGAYAFSNCNSLKRITIPASVAEIGNCAFESCGSLESVTIESDNTYVYPTAFGAAGASLSEGFAKFLSDIYNDWLWAEGNSDFFIWRNILLAYKGSSKTPVIPSGVTAIGENVFQYTDITGVTIPSGVKIIGACAFYECKELLSVSLPQGLEQIDYSAFNHCEKLSSLTFGSGLKRLNERAFSDCTSLKSVSLPDGIETLGDCVFDSCENLAQINFPSSITTMDTSCFAETKWYNSLPDRYELYCGSVFLGLVDRNYNDYPEELTVRPGTKTVFIEYDCDGLKKLNLPDGLKSLTIKTNYNESLTELTVPESVDYINVNGPVGLRSIKLPQTVLLEAASFSGQKYLKSVTLPKGTPYFSAFSGCDALESVTVPDDVLELNSCIGGENLRSIDLGNIRVLGSGSLANHNLLTEITLPDSLVAIDGGAVSGCTALTSVKGGKNVKTLGSGAFSGCVSLDGFGDLEQSVTWTEHDSLSDTGWYFNQPDGPVYFGKVAYCYKGTVPENTTLAIKEGTIAVTGGYITDQLELTPHNIANFEAPDLVGLSLPQSCKRIDYYAFFNCEKLRSVDLGGAVIIQQMAFNNHGCKAVNLPDTVRSVGDNAFSGKKLEAVHLNDGLRFLDEGAFFSYGAGKGVTIPESVAYLGNECIGYYPPEPGNPFSPDEPIDGFVITGKKGSKAEEYATYNEMTFKEESGCTSHGFVSETLSPTCITKGKTVKTCTLCGHSESSGITETTGHKEVANAPFEATCCTKGHTGGSHCALCGEVLSDMTFTPALGHDFVISKLDDPSYVGYGVAEYLYYCRRCELRIYVNGAGPTPVLGDVDRNGTVNAADALLALQATVGKVELTYEQFVQADVNRDSTLSATDALLILQYVVGKIGSF